VVLFLLFVQPASTAPLSLDGKLQCGFLEVTVQNKAEYDVLFDLDLQLKKKTENWEVISHLDCGGNYSLGALKSMRLNCSYTVPTEQGEYKIYARADIVNGTYTYKNFFFKVGESGFERPKPESGIALSFLSVPEKVKTGEEFQVAIRLTTYEDADLEIYSYVYGGKTCYSFYGWKGNAQRYNLKKGESRIIILTDVVKHKAASGFYNIKVRARGRKDWDIVRAIEVEQVPPNLSMELPESNAGQSLRWVLFLSALTPLLILIAKNLYYSLH